MHRLNGKTAVVLGAASRGNMGQVMARRLAAEGVRVMAAGRHREELERLCTETGGSTAICDLTCKPDLDALALRARDSLGNVDIVINTSRWGQSPGLTETPMTAGAKAIPGLSEAYRARYPLGLIGTVDDIAAAVVWLASDECFLTGQNLQVNGGLTLRGNPSRADIDASILAATGMRRPRPWDVPEKKEQARL